MQAGWAVDQDVDISTDGCSHSSCNSTALDSTRDQRRVRFLLSTLCVACFAVA